MEFEWDPPKSDKCLRDRGFSFADVLEAFIDPRRTVLPDDRHDYGEARWQLYGHVKGRLFCIIYTVRAQTIRIISARKANERERKRYGNS